MSTARPRSADAVRRREGDRWATVGGAAVAAATLVCVLVVVDYRVSPAVDAVALTGDLAVPFAGVLPVAAVVGVWLALDRHGSLAPVSAGLRGGFAAGLYSLIVALVFLTLANVRAFANGGHADAVFTDLAASGVVFLFSFPVATTVGTVLGTLVALTVAD